MGNLGTMGEEDRMGDFKNHSLVPNQHAGHFCFVFVLPLSADRYIKIILFSLVSWVCYLISNLPRFPQPKEGAAASSWGVVVTSQGTRKSEVWPVVAVWPPLEESHHNRLLWFELHASLLERKPFYRDLLFIWLWKKLHFISDTYCTLKSLVSDI